MVAEKMLTGNRLAVKFRARRECIWPVRLRKRTPDEQTRRIVAVLQTVGDFQFVLESCRILGGFELRFPNLLFELEVLGYRVKNLSGCTMDIFFASLNSTRNRWHT